MTTPLSSDLQKALNGLIETLKPIQIALKEAGMTDTQKTVEERTMEEIEDLIEQLIPCIDEDADRDGLIETPRRVAKAWVNELFHGQFDDPFDHIKTFDLDTDTHDLVLVSNLPVYSTCEHHMLPIFGLAHIAYIPDKKVLGLSKFGRVINAYARRLQIQERLTMQIADSLDHGLDPQGIMVVIEARHFCMEIRGIQSPGTITTTSAIRGVFETDGEARSEALHLIMSAKRKDI